MGQQQLLLLVLGVVVVALAVVAGISAFSDGQNRARHEAIMADMMRIASDVQAWKAKSSILGGGDQPGRPDSDFSGVNLRALGYPNAPLVNGDPYTTTHACYQLAVIPGDGARVTAYRGRLPADCGQAPVVAVVTISGILPADLVWSYSQAAP